VLSLSLYIGRIVLMIAVIAIVAWYGRNHPDNLSRTTLYFFLATLPLALASIVAETLAWNYDLRRKGLIAKGAIFPVRQMPPE
jgi:cytochrome bd-type quinol oxidase subunit 1